MPLTIGKWGNSLAVRIPSPYANELHWSENTEVECSIRDGKLILEALHEPVYQLEDLLVGMNRNNRHEETQTGPSVGSEA